MYTLDGTTFTVVDGTNTVGPVENRTFRIEFHEAGPSYGCVTTWPAVVSAVTGPRPAIPPQYMLLAMRGIDVKLDYFVQIHSD